MYAIFSVIWFLILGAYAFFALFNFLLPLVYSLPISIKFTLQKKTRIMIIFNVIIAPAVWLFMTIGIFFAIMFLVGQTQSEMFASVVFGWATITGAIAGTAMFLITAFQTGTRTSIEGEYYEKKYIRFLTDQQTAHYNKLERDVKTIDVEDLAVMTSYSRLDYIENFIIFCEIAEREAEI